MSVDIKTIFCDIDGCLVKHHGNLGSILENPCELLPGVKERLNEWERAGYKIILTTGRRESLRKHTEDALLASGIFYDLLVMGLPRGPRVVINDCKPGLSIETAVGICLGRNEGLVNVNI